MKKELRDYGIAIIFGIVILLVIMLIVKIFCMITGLVFWEEFRILTSHLFILSIFDRAYKGIKETDDAE